MLVFECILQKTRIKNSVPSAPVVGGGACWKIRSTSRHPHKQIRIINKGLELRVLPLLLAHPLHHAATQQEGPHKMLEPLL